MLWMANSFSTIGAWSWMKWARYGLLCRAVMRTIFASSSSPLMSHMLILTTVM